jgi:hypothetical protein
MFCPKCGASNDDSSKFCLGCGGPLDAAAASGSQVSPTAPVFNTPPPYQAPPTAPAKKGHAGIVVVIVLLLVLAVAAGGIWFLSKKDDKDDDQTTIGLTTMAESTAEVTTAAQNQLSEEEVQDILANAGIAGWNGDWNSLTAEQKQAIESFYEAMDQNIQFTPDGMIVVDEDGVYTFGGKWPDSPLMQGVPKPAYGTIFSTSVEEDEVVVTFSGWSTEQLVDYISQVKAAGFDKDANEVNFMGMATYEANNGSVRINVAQVMGFYAISLEKL